MKKSIYFILMAALLFAACKREDNTDPVVPVDTVDRVKEHLITFTHDGYTIYGSFTTPKGKGPYSTIIINPGFGLDDRDATVTVTSNTSNVCILPELLNDTIRVYKELGDALVDSGYAVLRYDKLQYTYPSLPWTKKSTLSSLNYQSQNTNLSALETLTFHLLWLTAESAIDYVKTRSDVDKDNIILIGHSEGSYFIPFIAKGRSDIKALISLAGPRESFDSLISRQQLILAQLCPIFLASQEEMNYFKNYMNTIRTNTWSASTPTYWDIPANVWYDYINVTDSVAVNYNLANLPTLFLGMELDLLVPPSELYWFKNEVTITNDFWLMPGLNDILTPPNDPHVSTAVTDTIVYWLRNQNIPKKAHNN